MFKWVASAPLFSALTKPGTAIHFKRMAQKAEAVANEFVELGKAQGDLTLLKLLKLVYFAHGWHLAITERKPLINDEVEAWKFGPVVPSVYHAFKSYGAGPITSPCTIFDGNAFSMLDWELTCPRVPTEANLAPFFKKIWDTYGHLDAFQLSALTHQLGTPWYKEWFDRGGKDRRGAVIPNSEIADYFRDKMNK